jgi:NitT/TauT family transport system substrate-binding protein
MPPLISVRVAYAARGGGSAPIWIARESGFFEEEGLDAELILIPGSTTVTRALLEGEVQFGHFAAPAAARANLHGGDLLFLTGNLNQLVQSLVVRSDIREPAQLRGRTLGVGAAGDIVDLMARKLLAQHGLSFGTDVASRPIRSQLDALARMDAGEIDGAIFSPPHNFQALKRGYRTLIDALAQNIDYQLGGIVACRSFVDEDLDLARAVVRANVRGTHCYKTQPEFAIDVLRRYSELEDEEIARQSYRALERLFQRTPYPSLPGMQAVLDHLAEREPAARRMDPNSLLDLRWVRELEESGYIERLYAG